MLRFVAHTTEVLASTWLNCPHCPCNSSASAAKNNVSQYTQSADGHTLTATTQVDPDWLVMNMSCIFYFFFSYELEFVSASLASPLWSVPIVYLNQSQQPQRLTARTRNVNPD